MSFADVNALRKAGNLEQAFEMAQAELTADPENIWNKRSIAWVYFEQLKAAIHPDQFDTFMQVLTALSELNLPTEETMVMEQIAWQVGKMAFALQKADHVQFDKLDRLFQALTRLPFAKPSASYSFLLKAYQKSNKDWGQYPAFVAWWGFENLMPEDYLPDEMPDGKKSMALAEQVTIAYARKLIEGPIDKEKIEAFFPILDHIINEHPEYQYPPYFKGKLLLAIGDKENMFSAFLPFARKKQTEFWVWEQLGESFPHTDIRYAACLCRALMCRAEPQFLGKVRTKLTEWLLANEQPVEAKTEIEAIAAVYQAEGWRLPPAIQARNQEDWFQKTNALPDNRALYQQFQTPAEEILFGDLPEEVIVVDFVNRDKGALSFVSEVGSHGGLKYGKHLRNLQIGDLLLVRFSGESRDGMHRIFTIKPTLKETTSDLLRPFGGIVSIRSNQPFGFADQVFLEPEFVVKHRLSDGQPIKGDCMLSWNSKRNAMAWKAIRISKT